MKQEIEYNKIRRSIMSLSNPIQCEVCNNLIRNFRTKWGAVGHSQSIMLKGLLMGISHERFAR
jgi:hypothetical protein